VGGDGAGDGPEISEAAGFILGMTSGALVDAITDGIRAAMDGPIAGDTDPEGGADPMGAAIVGIPLGEVVMSVVGDMVGAAAGVMTDAL
jgi:hypothetical protein